MSGSDLQPYTSRSELIPSRTAPPIVENLSLPRFRTEQPPLTQRPSPVEDCFPAILDFTVWLEICLLRLAFFRHEFFQWQNIHCRAS